MPYPRLGRRAQAILIAAACSLTCATPSRATSYLWTGNGANNLFTATGNWSPNGQPGAADDVTFATGFNTGTDIRIASNQAVSSFLVTTSTPFSISAPLGDTLSFGTLYVNVPDGSADVTFNAPTLIAPNNSITVSSAATVTFNNSLGFNGGTTDTLTLRAPGDVGPGGTVNLNAATALRDFLHVSDGVTLNVRHTGALGTARLTVVAATAAFYADTNLAQPTLLAGGTLAVHQSHVTFSGALSVGPGNLATPLIDLADSGTVTINAGLVSGTSATPTGTAFAGGVANLNSLGTYAGTITLSAGNTAILQTVASAPNASFLLRDNSTLVLPTPNKGVTFTRPVALGPGGGAIYVPGTSTFQPAAGQITHNSQPLTKSGPGTLTFADATNLNTPIVVADGTLSLPAGLTGTSPITVNAPGNVDIQGYLQRPISGTGSITATDDAYFGNPTSTFSFDGNINVNSNAVTLLSLPSSTATVAGQITLTHNGRLYAPPGLLLTSSAVLAKPAGDAVVDSPVTLVGRITAPKIATGGTLTFASDLTSYGTITGNIALARAFSSIGSIDAGALTLDPTAVATLSGTSAASSTANNGQLRITGGAHTHPRVAGSGSITLSGGTLTTSWLVQSAVTLTAGSLKHTDPLPAGPPNPASRLNDLTIYPAASYDLNADTLLLDYTGPANSPLSRIRQYLAAGNLFSSAANSDHALAYVESTLLSPSRRQSLGTDDSAIVIQLALIGDANLDGLLNADDYALLDRSYARSMTNAHWSDGDFNYDGTIDQQDYLLIDTTLGQAQGFSPGFLSHRESQFGATYVSTLLTSVPEPSLPFLAACGLALPLLTRPRRLERHS